MIRIIIGGLIFLGVEYLLRFKKADDQLSYDVENVSYQGISNGSMNLEMDVRFSNPDNFDMHIQNIMLDVMIEDTKLASIKQIFLDNNKNAVPAGKGVLIPLQIQSAKLKDILLTDSPLRTKMLAGDPLPKEAHIKGTVRIAGIDLPYDKVVPFKTAA
jgi:LEA14-like dessication related protein